MSFRRAVLNAKYHMGLASRDELIADHLDDREYILQNLPLEQRESIRGIVSSLQDLNTVSDVPQFYNLMGQLHRQFENVADQLGTKEFSGPDEVRQAVDYIVRSNAFGYQPSGARAYRMFINPFSVPGFYSEMYWGFAAALKVIMDEVITDGFRIVPKKGVSLKRHREVVRQLQELRINEYRRNKLRHRIIYGNDWTLPERSYIRNQTDRLNLLIPDRIWPVLDKTNLSVNGWSYQEGYGYTYYPKGMLYHGKYSSTRFPDIGVPPTHSVFVDMEADMAAGAFNLQVFHRGGLIGFIVSMEDPASSKLNQNMSNKQKAILREEIKTQYSGGKAGLSILVSNYIKNVHRLTDLNTLDAAFPTLRDSTAKMLAVVLQIPLSRLAVSEKSSGVYSSTSLYEQTHQAFDKSVAAMVIQNDFEINQMLEKEFDIDDHYIEANGKFNAFTLAAAQAGYWITKTGAILNKNTYLERVLGMPPFPPDDPRGWEMLDNSMNRDAAAKPIESGMRPSREESVMYSVFDERTGTFGGYCDLAA